MLAQPSHIVNMKSHVTIYQTKFNFLLNKLPLGFLNLLKSPQYIH